MNGMTEVAKFADETADDEIVFPPQRKSNQPMRFTDNAGYIFEMKVMWANPELVSKVNEVFEEYKEFERNSKAALIAGLEADVDALIEGAQRAAKRLAQREAEEFEAMRVHGRAKDKLENCNEEYRQVSAAISEEEGLFTRAQQSEREGQREKASERTQKAALAESAATTAWNRAIQRKNQAANAAVAWELAARELQGELKGLRQDR